MGPKPQTIKFACILCTLYRDRLKGLFVWYFQLTCVLMLHRRLGEILHLWHHVCTQNILGFGAFTALDF